MKAPMTKQRRVIKLKRKPLNEMKVSFPSYSENERFARVAVSGFLTQLDPQIDELADVKTAVSEGVTNAIVHGYRNTLGEIFMQIRIFENRHVYIKIREKAAVSLISSRLCSRFSPLHLRRKEQALALRSWKALWIK